MIKYSLNLIDIKNIPQIAAAQIPKFNLHIHTYKFRKLPKIGSTRISYGYKNKHFN